MVSELQSQFDPAQLFNPQTREKFQTLESAHSIQMGFAVPGEDSEPRRD